MYTHLQLAHYIATPCIMRHLYAYYYVSKDFGYIRNYTKLHNTCTPFLTVHAGNNRCSHLLAVSLPISILLSLLSGFLLGLLVMWCGRKCSASRKTATQTSFSVPLNPVYNEVSHGANVQLQVNAAYGRVHWLLTLYFFTKATYIHNTYIHIIM